MILVDTSVWIGFLRGRREAAGLSELLASGRVASHPWIFGEMMVGNLGRRRRDILKDLSLLPQLSEYPVSELRDFVEKEGCFGGGLSLVDVQLLYASLAEEALLWTEDRSLQTAASHFDKAYREP